MPYIPSEEELEQRGGKYTLMGEDSYAVKVAEIKIERKPNPYDNGKMRDTAAVKLDALSFEDGQELADNDGNPTENRIFFDFLEIEKIGLKPKPSKARKFIAVALGQNIVDAIEFDSWDELIGKTMVAHVIIKKNGKNGIDDYRPVSKRRVNRTPSAPAPVALPGETIANAEKTETETPAEEKTDDVDLTEVAKEIFGKEADF